MPNYCFNKLSLEHSDPTMITRAVDAFKKGALLQEFIPCPQDLLETAKGWSNDEDKQAEMIKLYEENTQKHGYPSWYEHNLARWGTKWDVGEEDGVDEQTDTSVDFAFDSAWSPPIAAYHALEELGFAVTAYYYEPGMGFCGKYENGEDMEYPTENIDDIPEDICEECGIEELEYEDEE